MPISQTGKLSLKKNQRLLSKVTKLSKWQGAVVSDSKDAFFPHHPASPLCPGAGSMPHLSTVLHSQRLWGLAVKPPIPPKSGLIPWLGSRQPVYTTQVWDGKVLSACLFVCFCLLLSLGPSVSQFWSNPRTVCAERTPTYREGV